MEVSERIGLRKFYKTGQNFLQLGHQILVAVLVTLQDLVTPWSRNAIKNCIYLLRSAVSAVS